MNYHTQYNFINLVQMTKYTFTYFIDMIYVIYK